MTSSTDQQRNFWFVIIYDCHAKFVNCLVNMFSFSLLAMINMVYCIGVGYQFLHKYSLSYTVLFTKTDAIFDY